DDHHIAAAEAVAGKLLRAVDGDRRQLLAMRRVASERAEREVIIQIGTAEFQPRAALDVAGEQRQRHTLAGAQRFEQRPNTRQLADARSFVLLEAVDIAVP